jgi:hypothetical protein
VGLRELRLEVELPPSTTPPSRVGQVSVCTAPAGGGVHDSDSECRGNSGARGGVAPQGEASLLSTISENGGSLVPRGKRDPSGVGACRANSA